jgi:hypothetical protein
MSGKKIPEGYMEDARGAYVPIETIKPIDLERDQLVREIIARAEAHSAQIAEFRRWAFERVSAFNQESASKYKVKKLGGIKGNITLHTFDGRYRVQVATSELMAFSEQLQAARELIQKCIIKWAEGSRPEILALVNDAFQVDKAGKISIHRVLGLRKIDIEDKDWKRAMDAISDSVSVVSSKQYIRVYKRQDDGSYKPIPLDVASA